MKRLEILYIGVLCLILSYAFSYASDLNCVKRQQGKQVKIAWDAVTQLENGEDIYSYYPEGYAIGYLLYHSDKKELTARNKEIDSKPEPDPSPETYSTLIFFGKPCQKYVGVRAAIYRDKNWGVSPWQEVQSHGRITLLAPAINPSLWKFKNEEKYTCKYRTAIQRKLRNQLM